MNIDQIKTAVTAGKKVYWSSDRYQVIQDAAGQWMIACNGGSMIGLTWLDGATLNGEPEDFYIGS